MSKQDEAKAMGERYALAQIEAGQFRPTESPLSGEWADSPCPDEILRAIGIVHRDDRGATFSAYSSEFASEILDSWESGYNSAPWPSRGGAFANCGEIVGYVYRAEEFTLEQLHARYVERWIQGGACSPGARDMDMEDILNQRAAAEEIDRDDEYSFDSDHFPKVILAD